MLSQRVRILNLELLYPTVDLFVYELRDGLGDDPTQIGLNRRRFCQRFGGDPEKIKQRETQTAPIVDLLSPKNQRYQAIPGDNGYVYPALLNDTYALQIDLSPYPQGKGGQEPVVIAQLQPTRARIEQQRGPQQGNTLGQSWLVWGQLVTPDQDANQTAQECARPFFSGSLPEAKRGRFGTAELWEFERSPDQTGSLESSQHLLVLLFPADSPLEALKTVERLYRELLQLWHYRHKLQWIAWQAREKKGGLKQAASGIQQRVQHLPDRILSAIDLDELQRDLTKTLTEFAAYAANLSALAVYKYAIATNLDNYDKRLKTIAEFSKSIEPDRNWFQRFQRFPEGSGLEPLADFGQYAREKYQPQVEADYNSASASLRLLENTIKTIEGIIQLEQAKRDRQLEQQIASVGSGLGAAAVFATAGTGKFSESKWVDFCAVFALSILVGLVFAGTIRYFQRR